MNIIKCEVCGNVEFTKNGGMLKCDFCGTDYIFEKVPKPTVPDTEIRGKKTAAI